MFLIISLPCISSEGEPKESKAVEDLRSALPIGSKICEGKEIGLIVAAAKTRRWDALQVIIKALAYRRSGVSNGEPIHGPLYFPSILVLKEYFDANVCCIIFAEALGTDKKWMCERCALAIRFLATKEQIMQLQKLFSVNSAIGAAEENAKRLKELLDAEELEVKRQDGDLVVKVKAPQNQSKKE